MRHDFRLFLGFVLALSACSSDDNPPATDPNDAVKAARAAFFSDFHASRYGHAATDAELLERTFAEHPDSGPLAFDVGLAHAWHLAEWRRDPNPDGAALAQEAQQQVSFFLTASEKNPDDPRVDCFLGLALLGAGEDTADAALADQGAAILERGVERFPEFNLFCIGLAYDQLPADHPDFQRAVEAAWQTFDACFGESFDRANPDITPYLDQATDQGPKRVCWNDAIAPHNAEGFYLWVGDVLVKNGDVARAKVMYANATTIREYPAWPYRSLIEDRLGADLEERAARYRDDDPENDPVIAGASIDRNCGYCHASSAAE